MAVEIVLVRHGQSVGNRDRVFTGHGESPLTDLGHQQAEATGSALAARPVDFIYTSDLVRCRQTTAPLERLTGVASIETPALRERDVGDFTGLTFADVQQRWPDGWQGLLSRDATFRPPGGESHRDCGERVGAFLDALMQRHLGGRLILFSHGVAINHMLWHMLRHGLGVDPDATPRAFFQVDNCSLQRVEHRAEHRSFRILAVNDIAHLAGIERAAI